MYIYIMLLEINSKLFTFNCIVYAKYASFML